MSSRPANPVTGCPQSASSSVRSLPAGRCRSVAWARAWMRGRVRLSLHQDDRGPRRQGFLRVGVRLAWTIVPAPSSSGSWVWVCCDDHEPWWALSSSSFELTVRRRMSQCRPQALNYSAAVKPRRGLVLGVRHSCESYGSPSRSCGRRSGCSSRQGRGGVRCSEPNGRTSTSRRGPDASGNEDGQAPGLSPPETNGGDAPSAASTRCARYPGEP